VADTLGGFRSRWSPRSQRRGYHQYKENPPGSAWQRNKPSIVVGSIIGICCTGFVGSRWAQQRAENFHDYEPNKFLRENFVCSLDNVRAGRWWVVLSSSLAHISVIHLGANMLTLWSIGPPLVAMCGAPAFLALWVTSELCCSAASLWWDQRREEMRASSVGRRWNKQEAEKRRWFLPKDGADGVVKYGGSIGASGAVFGMFGAVMCFAPNSQMYLFPLPIPLRTWVYAVALAGWSLYCLDSGTCAWLGHAGHLGGLGGGIASYYGIIRPWLRRMPRL